MRELKSDKTLIAACGLYCGACGAYLKEKCDGCSKNLKAEKWCKIKLCCKENNYKSCADCKIENVNKCKKFNNVVSKVFALIFGSNRKGCVEYIKKNGYEKFAENMTATKDMSGKKL